MAVPQHDVAWIGFFRRICTLLPFRPNLLCNGSASCGTAIAVPYNLRQALLTHGKAHGSGLGGHRAPLGM